MSRAGLKKVAKSVKGKNGTVRRSYWVKAQEIGSKATRVALKEERVKPSMIARLFNRGKTNVLHSFNHSGPNSGSDHSIFAHIVGHVTSERRSIMESSAIKRGSKDAGSYEESRARRAAGMTSRVVIETDPTSSMNYSQRHDAFVLRPSGPGNAAYNNYDTGDWVRPRRVWDR